jgi:uncharacterized protein YggT (Ycf19 family)
MEESHIEETHVSHAESPHVDRPVISTRIAQVKPAYNYKAEQAIWFVVGVVDALLIIRFLLKLLGASLASGFVRFMYDLTAPLVAPFHAIFNTVVSGRSILEPESVVAIAIYTLIGWGLASLIRLMTSRPAMSKETDIIS